jgi:D-alanyl-lipoteichoic acid acyltransferase DltB (MBOAT superfamily)
VRPNCSASAFDRRRRLQLRRRAALLWLSLGFNLTLLGFFKYFNFFADNLHALFARSAGSSTSSRCACCCRSGSRSTRS